MKKILIATFALALMLLLWVTHPVSAQQLPTSRNQNTEIVPDNLPGTSAKNSLIKCGNNPGASAQGTDKECDFGDLIALIQNLLNLTIAFSAFVATGMFMYAGFLMLTAMGNVSQIEKAKAVFRRVVVGFLIMFMAFLLVQQTLKYLQLNEAAQKVIGRFIKLN
jgi:hypothetical protein